MLKNIIWAVFIASLVFGCSDLEDIESPPKSIRKIDNIIYAEGRWKALPEAKVKFISKINSVSITCNRDNMTCEEIQSFLYTPQNEPQLDKCMLNNLKTTYIISKWDDDVVKARKYPVADIEILISLKDNSAEKIYYEKKYRSGETSEADIYNKLALE